MIHPFNRTTGTNKKTNPLLNRWYKIKQLTSNPNNDMYHLYGGNGIKLDDDWKDNYKNFLLWAVKNGYIKGKKLARKDKNKDFNPANCYFV